MPVSFWLECDGGSCISVVWQLCNVCRDPQTESSSLSHDASEFGELALCGIAREVQTYYNTVPTLSHEQLSAEMFVQTF